MRRQSRPTQVRINVTVTLPQRLSWLLAGIALGALRVPDLVVELTRLVLRHVSG